MARPTSTGPAITTDTPRTHMTEKAEPLINEMEEVIGKTRDEILSGVSKQEVETLLHLIRKLEQNILDLQAKD